MLFSQRNKDCRGTILSGCVAAGAVMAILITFIASFWFGWFTPESLALLWQSFLSLTSLFVLFAIVGYSDFFEGVAMVPLVILACALAGTDEEREEAY